MTSALSVSRRVGSIGTPSTKSVASAHAMAGFDAALVADEHGGVLFGVWLVGRATIEAIDRRIAASGLSAMEFPIYCLLDLGGSLTPSALGLWMAAPPTTVSAVVKRLERRGHVVRRANPADGRSYLIELTDAGRAAQEQAIGEFAPLAAAMQTALGAHGQRINADLLELRRVLDAVRETESAAARARRPPRTSSLGEPPPAQKPVDR